LEQAEIITVPSDYQHPLFFSSNQINLSYPESFEEAMRTIPFIYEITKLEFRKEDATKPWEAGEHAVIHKVLKLWEEEQKVLNSLFEVRNRKEAQGPMMWSIVYFLNCLFWSNGQRVPGVTKLREKYHSLSIKPINVEERLEFIIQKPSHYHSYIQLSELFTEFKKQYYKQQIINVSKSKKAT